MKVRKIAFAVSITFTLVIIIYFSICLGFFVSDSYAIFEGTSLKSSLPFGIYADEAVTVSDSGAMSGTQVVGENETRKATIKILNVIPVKEVSVKSIENVFLYPSGECIGIKMYSKGIVVVGFSDFETPDGVCVSPGAVAGLRKGDIIVSINGKFTSSVKEITNCADTSGGECVLGVKRGEETFEIKVNPALCTDGHMRMGIFVKNSVAGVGTMTYVTKEKKTFAALGHGITESDTGVTLPIQSATVYKAEILNITKGEKGRPGEMAGAIDEGKLMGECTCNSQGGMFGILTDYVPHMQALKASPKGEVTEGDAKVICTVEKGAKPREYDVRILSVNRISLSKTKSFVIEITDKDLLSKTGGIIQGMSGSPIIQNGKLIGAVTHVFVNDPTRGYGIFIENMLAEAEKIK